MTLDPLTTLVDGPEFRTGLRFGVVALVAGAAVALLWRSLHRPWPAPVSGIVAVVAGTLALQAPVGAPPGRLLDDPGLPLGLVLGLAAVAAAGVAAEMAGWPPIAGAALAVPGAALVAWRGELVDVGWIRGAVAVGTVVGGWMMASFDRRWAASALAPAMVALSAVGIYFTVPDTEEAMVLLGVAAPVAVLGWPLRLARLGSGGALAVAGLACWTVAEGGYGRPSSIVGGLACVGLFAVEPLTAWAWPRWPQTSPPLAVAVLSIHLALVFVASRVAGLRRTVPPAIAVAGATLVVAVAVALGVAWARRRRSAPDRVAFGAATERRAR